ncbi:MAG: hypothetical protein SCABRO_01292 [Candidatus Scalindua brodae]|uniref:Uncharacterized protein n=1 Tax=Candidatus Scalindua brodae TaxID=237368 RepID=A0A0B0EP85_9BACT|nr:MAG: hypothetical protein SCABRO_01292 [Candidatus Scalindua brodae]
MKGFYVGVADAEALKSEFLNQLNQCWLYCPDEVIKNGYAFLDSVHTKEMQTGSVKEKAMGELVSSIRKDLLSRKLVKNTILTESDFRHLQCNDIQQP